MFLKITNYNSFFKIKGILNKNNVNIFYREFENVFERLETITISIEDIAWMDKHGVNALAELHNESIRKNKKLAIIGLGCKELYEHFKSQVPAVA